MSATRPTEKGGEIAVTNSAALALLHVEGLPPGTKIFNEDVGHFFTLSTCAQTAITIGATDGYTAAQWTFANATFTDHEGDTLLIALNGTINERFGGAYTIDTVDSATVVTVTPAPSGSTTAPLAGSAVLIENALTTDVTVAVFGTIGSVWRLDTSDSEVASVTGTSPIVVDNTDPQNPIITLPVIPASTLAGTYAASVAISDAAQTMVGTYFSQFFDDDGHLLIYQTPATAQTDASTHPGLEVRRWHTSTVGANASLVTDWIVQYTPSFDYLNGAGIRHTWTAADSFGHELLYLTEDNYYILAGGGVDWYSPTWGSSTVYTRWQRDMYDRFGGASPVYFNSDGVHWRQAMFPDSVTVRTIFAESISVHAPSDTIADGSGVRFQVTGPATGPAGGTVIGGYDVVLDDSNFGSAEAVGHVEIWGRGPALGGARQVAAIFGPSSRAMVDLISAELDFETATSEVVIPIRANARFIPQAAWVEFTSVNTLTVGPTIELGNNAGEDNVAGALACANTNVTDSLVPFVMAVAPSVITLTTTAVTAHFTVNATATTCLGRIHISGYYVNFA